MKGSELMIKTAFLRLAEHLVISIFILFSFAGSLNAQDANGQTVDPFEQNRKLGKGVNLGNALEAPSEGEWGMVVQEEFIQLITEAGFDAV